MFLFFWAKETGNTPMVPWTSVYTSRDVIGRTMELSIR